MMKRKTKNQKKKTQESNKGVLSVTNLSEYFSAISCIENTPEKNRFYVSGKLNQKKHRFVPIVQLDVEDPDHLGIDIERKN